MKPRMLPAALGLLVSCSANALAGQPRDTELQRRLDAALEAKGPDYSPRTEHRSADGRPEYTNRLILEDSPYLIQHAHNPVDWYPWGEAAFARARRENKPIFLSIGYSTCHWCHVMERESFDTVAVARILNRGFISIKVDRERRPDLDEIYMSAVTLITRRGGWPLSVFLTPDGQPFWGGTYLPAKQFKQQLLQIAELWHSRRNDLIGQARRVAAHVAKRQAGNRTARTLDEMVLMRAVQTLLKRYDPTAGGFGPAPKFPNETVLLLLLNAEQRSPDTAVRDALEKTLRAIAQGGIHDQVGGGFHRYATDRRWRVPHFEKMLYNQALLAQVYLRAFRLTGELRYARVARQTLDYVLRDMTAARGGFHSATDADSEGHEGRFFVWTPAQIRAALTPDDAELALQLYGVTDTGNFEGANILFLPLPLDRYAQQNKMPLPHLLQRVDRLRNRLRTVRETRPHPLLDNKILTAWNGLMIGSLALAADTLEEPRYLQAARRAAEFLWNAQYPGPGRLLRVHWQGRASIPATLNDYAFFADGLLQLYDATQDNVWLERARQIADGMSDRFLDRDAGGFFMNAADTDPAPMIRPKVGHDSALPSGNGIAARVLTRLFQRRGRIEDRDRAGQTLAAFSGEITRHPSAYRTLLAAAIDLQYGDTGPHQYAARGAVSVTARRSRGEPTTVTLDVRLRPGWHINAQSPLQSDLIATELTLGADASGWTLTQVQYPEPRMKRLGFQRSELALYEGRFDLRADLTAGKTHSATIPLRLALQACNDRSCLAPETLFLSVPAAAPQRASQP